MAKLAAVLWSVKADAKNLPMIFEDGYLSLNFLMCVSVRRIDIQVSP